VTLREAGCGFCRWTVEVLFDKEEKMYLHTGWKKFARDHDVKVGRYNPQYKGETN
jgi:peptide methionine sulfoxide reductase MsrB